MTVLSVARNGDLICMATEISLIPLIPKLQLASPLCIIWVCIAERIHLRSHPLDANVHHFDRAPRDLGTWQDCLAYGWRTLHCSRSANTKWQFTTSPSCPGAWACPSNMHASQRRRLGVHALGHELQQPVYAGCLASEEYACTEQSLILYPDDLNVLIRRLTTNRPSVKHWRYCHI
jgi:hypothetical protein